MGGPQCAITVGEQTCEWREGQVLVFDTSYIHSCVNNSSRDRYVLVCRFWHPMCSDEERYGIIFLLAVMDRMKQHGNTSALFQASPETHGPAAAVPGPRRLLAKRGQLLQAVMRHESKK